MYVYSVVSVNGLRSVDKNNVQHFENVLGQVVRLIVLDKPMDPEVAVKV